MRKEKTLIKTELVNGKELSEFILKFFLIGRRNFLQAKIAFTDSENPLKVHSLSG